MNRPLNVTNFALNKHQLAAAAAAVLVASGMASAQAFSHPGGVHTKEDLDRMRDHVAKGDSPWIESWNALVKDPKAQLEYKPSPRDNIGASRQRAAADAVAVYVLTLRGYISGDHRYTDHAIDILNRWSAAVNRKPSGSDQPGLNGIFTYQFACDAEMLRMYVGDRWKQDDFERFKRMMREYLYPVCHDFLTNHNNQCITHWWTNWDACNITAVAAMGVLLDDREMFNEAVDYYKHGVGNGCIEKAVYFVHPDGLGQWQEAGRDMEHATLGIGLLATFCEIARHQGLDLYSYDNNRLLAGAEYAARYQMWKDVPYKTYTNCDEVNNFWASRSQRGRLSRPIWEQLYNQYVVRMGLKAPNVEMIAKLNRPEAFTSDDHFGYGTLAFTLEPSAYPPLPIPTVPQGLKAIAGLGRINLEWTPPENANGFTVQRATDPNGPFEEIAKYRNIIPEIEDRKVDNGKTYYYKVSATNQAGGSEFSTVASATPSGTVDKLPEGWSVMDVGQVASPGKAEYADAGDGTFVCYSSGQTLGGESPSFLGEGDEKPRPEYYDAGTADGISLTGKQIEGDTVLTVRLIDANLRGGGKNGRIGIAIRASLDGDAVSAAMMLGDLGYRWAHFGRRLQTGQPMQLVKGNAYTGLSQLPTWFRLTRVGNKFIGYQSKDGQDWHEVASADIDMPANAYVGIAVSSGSDKAVSATFDHVAITDPKAK